MSSIREQYVYLFPPSERAEVERQTRRLSNDDNSAQLWVLLMVKRCESILPAAIGKTIVGNLEAVKELNRLISGRAVWIKLAAILLFLSLSVVGIGVATEYFCFKYLAHSLSNEVLQKQGEALQKQGKILQGLEDKSKEISELQSTLSDKQGLLLKNQKALYESQLEQYKTLEAAKGIINQEKDEAVKSVRAAANMADSIKVIGEALRLQDSELMKFKNGDTGLSLPRGAADIVLSEDGRDILLFHPRTKSRQQNQ